MAFTRRHFLAAIAALPLLPLSAHANHGKDLHFLTCPDSVDERALQAFQKELDIEVQMELYNDETQFIAKFLGGEPRYDTVLASDDNIAHLTQTDLLGTLSRTLIPHVRQLEPRLVTLDTKPKPLFFSLPLIWGTVGIAYRKSVVSSPPESWKTVLDSDRYAGRIVLPSEKLPLFQVAQKYLGHSINDHEPKIIEEAEKLLIKQKPNIMKFSKKPAELLRSGKGDLAMVRNSDFLKILEQTGEFGYTVPREGTLIWQKSLCIPKHAGDPVAAHKLIDFLLDKETAARLSRKFRYATPNKEAWALLGESYMNNPALSLPEEILSASEIRQFPLPERNELYKTAWKRVLDG